MIFGVCISKMNQQLNLHNFFFKSKNNNEWNDENKNYKSNFKNENEFYFFFPNISFSSIKASS
jgi:hypothetical protein